MKKLITALATCAIATVASTSIAAAASISYVGSDGNVYLVSPDGQLTKQITSNATDDNRYRTPTQTDSGRIFALRKASSTSGFAHVFDHQGNQTDGWNLPASGIGGAFAPFNGGQIAPEGNGGLLAYDYWHSEGPLGGYATDVRVGFVAAGGLTNPCTINCQTGAVRPRWLPGTPYAGFLDKSFDQIKVQSPQGVKSWISLNQPGQASLQSFDVARTGGKVAIEVSPEGAGSDTASFEFYSFNGVASDTPQINFICSSPSIAPARAFPHFSPDGSMISWGGADGIYVSPAPTAGANGICNLQPKLIAPGGKEADWGKVDLPKKPIDPDPDPITPDEPKPTGQTVKSGLVVTIDCPEACSADVRASVDKKTARKYGLGKKATVVASGGGEIAAAGSLETELTFTSKARKKLKKANKLKLALVADMKLASGANERLTGSVTLKR